MSSSITVSRVVPYPACHPNWVYRLRRQAGLTVLSPLPLWLLTKAVGRQCAPAHAHIYWGSFSWALTLHWMRSTRTEPDASVELPHSINPSFLFKNPFLSLSTRICIFHRLVHHTPRKWQQTLHLGTSLLLLRKQESIWKQAQRYLISKLASTQSPLAAPPMEERSATFYLIALHTTVSEQRLQQSSIPSARLSFFSDGRGCYYRSAWRYDNELHWIL